MEEIELRKTKFTYTPNYWKYILGFICFIILIFTFSYNIYITHVTRDSTYKREGLQI